MMRKSNGSDSSEAVDPLLIVPKTTLILRPVSESGETTTAPLILRPVSEGGETTAAPLILVPTSENSPSSPSPAKTSIEELPRPNWSRKRFVDKIQLMKSPSPYDIHAGACRIAEKKPGRRSRKSKIIEIRDSDLEDPEDHEMMEPIVNLAPGFSIADVESNPIMCIYYTGFSTHSHLKDLYGRLHLGRLSERSPLSSDMAFLLTLTKLRTNKDFTELGFFFNVSPSKAEDIFQDWVLKLHEEFQKSVFWVNLSYILQVLTKFKSSVSSFFSLMLKSAEHKKKNLLEAKACTSDHLERLLHPVEMYKILCEDNPTDEITRRMPLQIAHVCFAVANYKLYPDYLLLLS